MRAFSRLRSTRLRPARSAAHLGLALLVLTLAMAGCRQREVRDDSVDRYSRPLAPGQMALELVPPGERPDFSIGFGTDRAALLQAIDESLAYYAKPSSKRYFPYLTITHDRAVRSLEALRELVESSPSGATLHREIAARFDVYQSVGCDDDGTVLFTGYCEPIYAGSRTPTPEFRYPLYQLPADLVKSPEGKCLGRRRADGSLEPYPTRYEIDAEGVLRGRDLELVWLNDPLAAYVVHVQGSARLRLPDGTEMRVGYAGKTDRPYRSLGEKLIEDGKIRRDDISLFTIRKYFDRHPDELNQYLGHNESYIFFRETHDGPYGSLNAKVTPMRTIATDKTVFPRGAMAFLDTRLPKLVDGYRLAPRPYRGFALDQDTGGAIRSAGRCDVFIGTGPQAERIAGHTKFEGRLYYLFLKEAESRQRTAAAKAAEDRTARR